MTSKKWYTKKFDAAGLRYEIAVSIIGGDIVWVNGPFLPGLINDQKVFETQGLLSHLEKGKRVEADNGYQHLDPEFVRSKSGILHPPDPDGLRNSVMARQEMVNKRIKKIAILIIYFFFKTTLFQ